MDSSSFSTTTREGFLGSSSSSFSERKRGGDFPEDGYDHDVFISFRGEDTRTNFTSHVYAALCRKQIKAFIDSKDLRTGHEISGSLLRAIEMSKLYLVIFSPNYASSSWCLMELERILLCSKQHGKTVIPVFYKVDPSHVRHQSGSFGYAFAKNHEARDEKEKVLSWRATLKCAADLSGLHFNDLKPETEFTDEIVEKILKELNQIPFSISTTSKVLVGFNSHFEKVMSLLRMDSLEVRSVGIWGMGGIGKTTIAEAIFYRIQRQFDGYYFFKNIREEVKRLGGVTFWNKLLSEILDEKISSTLGSGNSFLKQRLQRKRVFIVFDDVDDSTFNKLLDLAEHHSLFAMGSKILITSRDKHVLTKLWVDEVYDVLGLTNEEALKLFSLNAFKKEFPPVEYMELCNRVADYAQGNPLALIVVGMALLSRDKTYWDSALQKIRNFPKQSILDLLRISYDGLSHTEREIFFDIACFFKGEEVNHVEKLLGCFYDCAPKTIVDLVDKSLISISQRREIEVHDLVQEMVDEEEVTDDPGKRKRLCSSVDIHRVLMGKKGTEAIQGISLNLNEVRMVDFGLDSFTGMVNVRWLKVYGWNDGVCLLKAQRMVDWWMEIFRKNEAVLPHMRYICWEAFPFKSLSPTFNVQNLVKLHLPRSKIQRLWTGVQDVVNLRWMDISESRCLTEIPDLSKANNIERMILKDCQNLTKLHPSVQYLEKLEVLDLKSCVNLREIPSKLESKVLRELNLCNCLKIKECPQICSDKLVEFTLAGSKMKEAPDCIRFHALRLYFMVNCPNITKIPEIPNSLEHLCLWNTGVKEVPSSSLEFLNRLEILWLRDNKYLRSIPNTISRMESLRQVFISGCEVSFIPELPATVQHLDVQACPSLKTVSPISNQSQLESLAVVECPELDAESRTNMKVHTFLKLLWKKEMTTRIEGSQIPIWFPRENVRLGSSVTLQLPSDHDSNNYSLKAFGIWVASEFNPPLLSGDPKFSIETRILPHVPPDTDHTAADDLPAGSEIFLDRHSYALLHSPDHTMHRSFPLDSSACQVIRQVLSRKHCSKISFRFYQSQLDYVITKCGVYLAFDESFCWKLLNIDQLKIISKFFISR